MKQKINTAAPITKEELSDIIKDYPTKKDLSEALKEYATKKDLSDLENRLDTKFAKRLTNSQQAFHMEMDHKFATMKEEILVGMSQFTNIVLTTMDPLLKDLETRREDREIAAAEMRDIKKRLAKLEHS